MPGKILLVDDEKNILHSLRRGLHGRHKVATAEGGAAGIQKLRSEGPFAVIVSDMQMPEVDGLAVLSAAQEISPDTQRIMLTGNADQRTASDAVNEGAIFRFINKPCPADELADVLDEALRAYDVALAEKELLSKTLTGAISLVSEALSISNPIAFGRASRTRLLVRQIAEQLGLEDAWQFEVAAMLSQFGCIGVPSETLEKYARGDPLSPEEREAIASTASTGSRLVSKLPRLESIAEMIGNQDKTHLNEALPPRVATGAKMLRIAGDFDILCQTKTFPEAIDILDSDCTRKYDPEILRAFVSSMEEEATIAELPIEELKEKMVLDENVLTGSGDVLISQGHELTASLIQRLRTFEASDTGVRQPIRVQCQPRCLQAT